MADGQEFSAEAKRRFAEIKPENYKRELRRIGWKISEAQFLFGLLLFIGAITPLFALALSAVSGSFALFWIVLMGFSVVKAFRRIENPMTNMEVRYLILKAQHRDFLERAAKITETIQQNAKGAGRRETDERER